MFVYTHHNPQIRINFHSNVEIAEDLNVQYGPDSEHPTYHTDWLGGYQYPILDSLLVRTGSDHYQILKVTRPEELSDRAMLETILNDPNTLYSYPEAGKVTVVQFDNWDNTTQSLKDLGILISPSQKMFKRIKTFNRPFRTFHHSAEPIKVLLIGDSEFTRYSEFFSEEDLEKLFDGAFLLSQSMIDLCMAQLEETNLVFNEYGVSEILQSRNSEVKSAYLKSKIFNARLFGDMEIVNQGEYPYLGAIKGQAYTDMSGACEYYGVDVIAPYSAFKHEVNTTGYSFVLIEPQNAKVGQMFSDGQTIANMPALYQHKSTQIYTLQWFDDAFQRLINDEIMSNFSDLSINYIKGDQPKMYRDDDVKTMIEWNVRAWLMAGGSITTSPWLFEQMGKNLYDSMRINDNTKLRFPVPCAVRALVINESLYRLIYGCSDGDKYFNVELGTAHWVEEIQCLIVNDCDYVEMYSSHGGCDLDDFFQIYWRTIDGQKKIVICRSPNDWGEYSVFDYIEGDWHKETKYGTTNYSFVTCPSDQSLWPDRLSEVIESNEVEYTGLPQAPPVESDDFNADFVLRAMEASSSAAASVGINVNARQLWSASMGAHRSKQMASMEDCIDAGVQGGTDEQVQCVIEDGNAIVAELLESNVGVDAYLWSTKHAQYHKGPEPILKYTNISYLQSVRYQAGNRFMKMVHDYTVAIPNNADYSKIHTLGKHYITQAVGLLRGHRRAIGKRSNQGHVDFETMSQMLVGQIESYSEGHHRNAFMLSLYSACLITQTASGKITDQFVMQPLVFPYLLEALQFYGILGKLKVNEVGSIVRYYDNQLTNFEEVLEYQTTGLNEKSRNVNGESNQT